jgi:hypothetical protein
MLMGDIVSLNSKRQPVSYTIYIESHYNGEAQFHVTGIDMDNASVKWMLYDLKHLIASLEANHLDEEK